MPRSPSRVAVLSFHADYRCHDSGACCTSGWPIPVEADRLEQIASATARGHLRGAGLAAAPLWCSPADAPVETPALLSVSEGACVFYAASRPHHCGVQHALGHEALPLACRQFPRISLRDPRGTSVTLSHFCPTVASLVERHVPDTVQIVVNAPLFPCSAEYVGLDASESLPPLLRPGVLMDWDSWSEWEQRTVDWLTTASGSAADALAGVAVAVETLRTWTPADGPLLDAIHRAWLAATAVDVVASAAHGFPLRQASRQAALLADVAAAVPGDFRPPLTAPGIQTPADVARRFLAAHAFANWTAHLGSGLRTWLRSVETALAFIDAGYGVRESDRWLRHLADPYALARSWSRVEMDTDACIDKSSIASLRA